MSDEKPENKPTENPTIVNPPQEISQESKPVEKPIEDKKVELNESFAGKTEAGSQGISLRPLGSHATDPFVSQDTTQSQPPPAQPSPVQQIIPSSTQSSGNDSSDGE